MADAAASFPIPASLQDLEHEPYNLFPYPDNFRDDDEATRADSFANLVAELEQSNVTLQSQGIAAFSEKWLDTERLQALYTLVRKSSSLSPATRKGLFQVVAQTCTLLANILDQESEAVPQNFRDAAAAHLYMTFSLVFAQQTANEKESPEKSMLRETCVNGCLTLCKAMSENRANMWHRGVPDDQTVILLPCRLAYLLLEKATGVIARRSMCGDQALEMIQVTIQYESTMTSVAAALMDLLHSHEHMAGLVAELCAVDTSQALAIDLLRETGRLEGSSSDKASGIKNVAPFVSELAQRQPRIVLGQLVHLEPHLRREAYPMRSALVLSMTSILEHLAKEDTSEPNDESNNASIDIPKIRTNLLERILERVYDVSSFTRSTVLKAILQLVQSQALPKSYVTRATELAMDRLNDKTVMVRKQAMQLLTALLENNPFMGSLDPAPYKVKLQELQEFIMSNLPSDLKEAHEAAVEQAEDENAKNEICDATFRAALAEVESWNADELTEEQQTYVNKVQAIEFTQASLEFIHIFDSNPSLEGMLLSANTSDVTQALRFFVQANHFSLPCSVKGVKRSLALMWSTEQSIRDEVLKAFCDVFLCKPGSEELLEEHAIAKNLLVLVGQASVSELASIEEAITLLVKAEKIPADVFLILWSIASKGSSDARAAAITVLGMGARADRGLVDSKSRLRLLLEAGLGDYTQENRDWRLAGACAVALQRCERSKIDHTDAKFLVMERVMVELCAVARGDWCNDDDSNETLEWFSTAEQTIKALFCICPEPELACKEIVNGMYASTFCEDQCHPLRLARFFHVLGQISLELLVYTEALSSSVRRATAKKSLKKQEQADNAKAQKSQTDEEDDAIEAELGIAAEAEAENERKVAEISEQEILGRGLISAFAPLLIRVVGNEGGKFTGNSVLMQSSTLALCKFMCVSRSFCEKHLPLLFTALQNAPEEDTIMRANTVVALGDLAFRFPNEVEPYTPRLYSCLRDSSTKVRRHTLMVLTHLILNDMVKVKGQVCEIALCLRDHDPRIRDMSRLLFHELSKRSNNPIYNLLPDIISQLSQLPSNQKDDFRSIMSFLLGYIKKERQNEQLVDKLCQRFPKCETVSQKADLSYCLAQLKLNERSVKTLSDNFKLYKDALFDEDVKKSFLGMLSKAKKTSKPEQKQLLDEWEQKIEDSAELGAENERADMQASKAKKRAKRRAARKKTPLATVAEENA